MLAGLFTRAAPWPGNAAPCVEGICQTLPTQSVRFTATVAFVFCAESSSITFWASRVADVSLLFRLSVSMVPTTRVVRAPSPVASTSMAIISSIRVAPRSGFFWNTAVRLNVCFMASFDLSKLGPDSRGSARKKPSLDSAGRGYGDGSPILCDVVLEKNPIGRGPSQAVADRASNRPRRRAGKTARTKSNRCPGGASVLGRHGGSWRQYQRFKSRRTWRRPLRLGYDFAIYLDHRVSRIYGRPVASGSSVHVLGVYVHKSLLRPVAVRSEHIDGIIAVIIHRPDSTCLQ